MASVSFVTSSAGISTEISRLTPSFLASMVSVGLTNIPLGPIPLSGGRTPDVIAAQLRVSGWTWPALGPESRPIHTPVTLSVKRRADDRQTREGRRERRPENAPPLRYGHA